MGWFSSSPALNGRYMGVRDQALRFKFEFRGDGTYSYKAYQDGGPWELVHHGAYKLKHTSPGSSMERARHFIVLRPARLETTPSSLPIRLLQSRDLPTTEEVEYEVTFPSRKDDPYILFVPAKKAWEDRNSWMIRPASEQ